MADNTGIEWCDSTWNPISGCTKVSPGCDHCYAETFAERWRGTPGHYYENGFDVQLRPDKLSLPLRWRKPRRIFVNSMSDLFHDQVPDDYIAHVFAVMQSCAAHTFQVLTKRHGRMRSLLNCNEFWSAVTDFGEHVMRQRPARPQHWPNHGQEHGFLPNVWLGVSAEDAHWAKIRGDALRATPAAIRFFSCEPLLGPIGDLDLRGIGWVIIGGESGRGARPMHPDWARSLRDQCQVVGVPFLFKQWGEWSPLAPLDREGRFDYRSQHVIATDGTLYGPGDLVYPDGPKYGAAIRAGHSHDHLTTTFRVGKKAAGRQLDGRTWDEYPQAVTHA